jgi:hypothetical protein
VISDNDSAFVDALPGRNGKQTQIQQHASTQRCLKGQRSAIWTQIIH